MSIVWHRFKEFFKKRTLNENRGTLLPAWKTTTGETPPISFDMLLNIYLSDPAARAAVDFLADQTVGAGFYTTAEEYEAKVLVDTFNEATNLDDLLLQTAREIVAFGSCFWEKVEPERLETLQILPVTSMDKIVRNAYGDV